MDRHPKHQRRMRALTAASLLACTLLASPARADTPADAAYAAALVAYESCHWREAYQAFGQLADAGHVQSARIALLMHRFGPRLFGQHFAATPQSAAGWLALASSVRPTPG